MRYPVTHDGQHLVFVTNLGRDYEPAIFQFLFDNLSSDQFASLEVTCNFAGNLKDNFSLFLPKPDAVFLFQHCVQLRVMSKSGAEYSYLFDLGKREGFELDAITGHEIPDSLVINQLERCDSII